jgi:hypothetical protein
MRLEGFVQFKKVETATFRIVASEANYTSLLLDYFIYKYNSDICPNIESA